MGANQRKRNEKVLRAPRPNVGIEAEYRRKIIALIDEMQRSYAYWLKAAYRQNEPVIAQDATPAAELQKIMNRLARQWRKRFNEASDELAEYFARSASRRSDAVLRSILKKAGMTVEFNMTAPMRDVMRAVIQENVGLIKSIQSEYATQVQGMVMRSVQAGRDLSYLTDELQKRYGITRRRAAFIARDQNNKASAMVQRTRSIGLELYKHQWLHSHAGKHPRPTHVKMDGKTFDIREGMYDSAIGKMIWPGTEPNCRCVARPIVEGLS